jgi:hypothetical protein
VIAHLLLGTLIIAITVAVQAEMYNLYSSHFNRLVFVARRYLHRFANTGLIIISVLYILLVQTLLVWLWALVFVLIGAFSDVEPALYFSLVTFTTVGYGDVTLSPDWRLLSGLTAANGFISFGWSTAYMVELVRRTA